MTRFVAGPDMSEDEVRILALAEKVDDVLLAEKIGSREALTALGLLIAIQFSDDLLPAIKAVAEVALGAQLNYGPVRASELH